MKVVVGRRPPDAEQEGKGKKTGVRDDRSDFTARAWGVGRTEEGLLLASSFCCESREGATSCSVARLWAQQQPAANLRDSALRNSAKCCASVPPTFSSHARRKRVETLPLLSLLSPVPLSHREVSAQQPRLSSPITDFIIFIIIITRSLLDAHAWTIPVPAVK